MKRKADIPTLVPPSTSYELTLASPDEIAKTEGVSGSGVFYELGAEVDKQLRAHPLAKAELHDKKEWKGRDAIHLSTFNGTNLIQWYGRCADGYYRPIGRVMKIIEVRA